MTVYTFSNLGSYGRLGNQLWQIAWQIGQSKKIANHRAFINPDWKYRKFFKISDEYYVPPQKCDKIIDGGLNYFQDLIYWEYISNYIHELFQPSEYLQNNLNIIFPKILAKNNHKTAIHVRRTDYLKIKNITLPDMEYYDNAMVVIKKQHPNTESYVFSDDIEWCRDKFRNSKLINNFVAPNKDPSDIYELALMSTMNSHIIANSTFSWWGAWLSRDPKPICPPLWLYFDNSNTMETRNMPFIPKNWRIMSRYDVATKDDATKNKTVNNISQEKYKLKFRDPCKVLCANNHINVEKHEPQFRDRCKIIHKK